MESAATVGEMAAGSRWIWSIGEMITDRKTEVLEDEPALLSHFMTNPIWAGIDPGVHAEDSVTDCVSSGLAV